MWIAVASSAFVHGVAATALLGVAWNFRYRDTPLTDVPGTPAVASELAIEPVEPTPPAGEPAPPSPPVPSPIPPRDPAPVLPSEFAQREIPATSAPTVVPMNASEPRTTITRSSGAGTPSVAASPATSTPPATISFAGVEAPRARSVVYVIDASGPMVSSWKWIQSELARSIRQLDESQRFQVVVSRASPGASGTSAVLFPARGLRALVPCTAPNKLLLVQWLQETTPGGRSDLLPGLRTAIELEPELVFVLTRSIKRSGPDAAWGAGKDATLRALEKINPRSQVTGQRAVVIKTIQLLEDDPTGTLQAIAEQHGDGAGSYRVITQKELKD